MRETVIDESHLARAASNGDREFVHLTLRDQGAGHAVEAVIGTVDSAGVRRGVIRQVVAGVALATARAAFDDQISERLGEGYRIERAGAR